MTFAVRNIGGLLNLGRAVDFAGASMDLISDSITPTITFEVYNNGTWSVFSNPTGGTSVTPTSGTWIAGTGTGSNYYIKITNFSEYGPTGSYTGDIDTWLNINTTRSWSFTQNSSHYPADPYFVQFSVVFGYWSADYAILTSAASAFSISKIPTFGGG